MRHLIALCAVFIAAIAGCRSEPPSAPPSETANPPAFAWPEKVADLRFRWSAGPDIDLVHGEAVSVRAYLESWLLTYYTGDPDAVYPGFRRVTPPPVQVDSSEWRELPYARRSVSGHQGGSDFDQPGLQILGNEDLHLLKLEPMPTGFRAFVCDSTFAVYQRAEDAATFAPLRAEWSSGAMTDIGNMGVWRIEFADRPGPSAPGSAQQGPAPAPRGDVFGPWFVTGAERVGAWWTADHPGLTGEEDNRHLFEARAQEDQLRQQCLDRLGIPPEERMRIATTELTSPPAVEPAAPGWPD